MYFDSLEVFRSRYPSVTLNVGAAATNDIRYQNPIPSTPSGLIKSICSDSVFNISSIVLQYVNIDWTNPNCITVSDGVSTDIDTTTSLSTLSANWTSSTDQNSGIAKYWYAIGTTQGATDIVNWTDNLLNTSVTKSGLTLSNGQHYYFSVKTVNGAGLTSICNSDGVLVNITTAVAEYSSWLNVSVFPNPSGDNFTISYELTNDSFVELKLYDILGKEISLLPKTKQSAGKHALQIDAGKLNLSSGVYLIRLSNGDKEVQIKLIKS